LTYSRTVAQPTPRSRTVAAVGFLVSLAAMSASILLWRITGPQPGCRAVDGCYGAPAHPHALASILLGLAATAAFVWTVSAARNIAEGRPAAIGGWRHPIDALGVRYRDLPYWRKVAIAVLASGLVAAVWVIYEVRRALLGPPAE